MCYSGTVLKSIDINGLVFSSLRINFIPSNGTDETHIAANDVTRADRAIGRIVSHRDVEPGGPAKRPSVRTGAACEPARVGIGVVPLRPGLVIVFDVSVLIEIERMKPAGKGIELP